MSDRRLVSLVVPVLNEERSIGPFLDAIREMQKTLEAAFAGSYALEIVFVDDGSTDGTVETIKRFFGPAIRIRIIELSRNFGKEAALTAGLDAAEGDAVIPIDVDLQDPPELIIDMIREWRSGFEVVLARRVTRSSDRWLKRWTAMLFYQIHNSIARTRIPKNVGDFRLMDRVVVDALKELGETQRFMKGLFAWIGFGTTTVDYERKPRSDGESKFRGVTLWNLALEGITSFSVVPLKIWIYVGVVVAFFAFMMAAVVFFQKLFLGLDIPGYAMLSIAIFFFAGVQLLSIGLLGEYLACVHIEAKRRPIYVVRKRHGG